MSVRFVKFDTKFKHNVWINPANVAWVQKQAFHTDRIAVATADSDSPFYVVGTLEEVLDKLTGKTPPKSFQPHSTT